MKRLWSLFFLFLFITEVFSQKPVTPDIVSVSVTPGSDSVTMKWSIPPTEVVNGFIIMKNRIGGLSGIPGTDVIIKDPTRRDTTFYFPEVQIASVQFSMFSYRGNIRSLYNPSPHGTIFNKVTLDSCNSQVKLAWTKYIGWSSQLTGYEIYQEHDGVVEKKGETSPNDTTYTIGINANKSYLFYVVARHADGITFSRSNDTLCFTQMPEPPKFIDAKSASFINNNTVNLKFLLDPDAGINDYRLYASDSPDGEFTPLRDITGCYGKSTLNYTDTLKSKLAPRYYRLDAINLCKLSINQSNLATAIVPTISSKSYLVDLSWNTYLSWPVKTNHYTIYRSIGGGNFDEVGTITGESDHYSDDVKALIGMQLPGNLCYKVEAVSNADMEGNPPDRSVSAPVCIDLSENIFIPNAFTPNADGFNDDFKPVFPFLPQEYVLLIYNRYGFKIFESKDPLTGWKGTLENGKKAPDGTYVYFVKFTSSNGKTIEKRGNFSLIYSKKE